MKQSFQKKTLNVPLTKILPTKSLGKDIRESRKFKTIFASIKEVGIIEPLVVYPDGERSNSYILLDGHVRLEALKALEAASALCIVSTDDEGFTYNRQINRLSPVQEHKMILQAVAKGVSPERIAKSLNVEVDRIRERQRLLQGIATEAVELLKNRMVSHGVFGILRKMKPLRQIEAAEMMISANRLTVPYARMIFAATRQDLLIDLKKNKPSDATPEDIGRMERQMEKLYQDYKLVEDTLGETMLVLVVAKGYVTRLMRNKNISAYLDRNHRDLSRELEGVMEAVASEARSAERE